MADRVTALRCTILVLTLSCCSWARDVNQPPSASPDVSPATLELARYLKEFSSVRLEPARMDSAAGIALVFEGTADLHYYAKPETAPAPGFELKVKGKSDLFNIGHAVFPKWHIFTDSLGENIEVFSGNFVVFLPIALAENSSAGAGSVEVAISGIACTSLACLSPFEKTLHTTIDLNQNESWRQITLESRADERPIAAVQDYSIWFALPLAFLAGLILNLMPCVWPVLPLIVMRIVEQAKQAKEKSATTGLTFCLGILLFFACLAAANIILRVVYGTVLQWGDQFRSPLFVGGMALLLVVLALSMFGVLTITVPSSIVGKAGSGKGYSGAIATGFLAAILSTPCGFGVLAASFGWAQAQHWLVAAVAIMTMGLGMAAPYAVLVSMPALLSRLPRPGKWMELFKQGIGFVLLIIAVKLISALPQTRRADVLYFAVVLAFCVWMLGAWTDFTTKPFRRRLVKIIAAALAIGAGWVFLAPPASDLIDWQDYDPAVIDDALAEERPVLIKFTADWCLSCQAAEKLVYAREDIAALIEQRNILPIKADTTDRASPATATLRIYGEPGVPVTILFPPGDEEPLRMHGPWFARELKRALTKIADNRPGSTGSKNQ